MKAAVAALALVVGQVSAHGSGFGKSTYAMSDPLGWATWMNKYVPVMPLKGFPVNSTEQCVMWAKLCIDDGNLKQCGKVSDSDFQMHAVGAFDRESGAMSMEQIETDVYGSALGDFAKYDPYMENNVGLYTKDLDTYVKAFEKDGVPHFAMKFTEPSSKKTFYSILVRAHTSPVVLELMGDSAILAARADVYAHPGPRGPRGGFAAHDAALAAAERAVGENGMPVVTFTHKSFASSDAARDKAFWTAMGGIEVATTSAGGASSFAGTLLKRDAAEMIFVEAANATQGKYDVKDWEAYQNALHKKCIVSETKGFDRLADSHVGHSFPGTDISSYIAGVKAYTPTVTWRYFAHGLFYAYMPNGWGMQLSGKIADDPKGGGYDFCKVGVKPDCSA